MDPAQSERGGERAGRDGGEQAPARYRSSCTTRSPAVGTRPAGWRSRPRSFAAQLGYLREAGFTALTVSGLASALAGARAQLPTRPVVITFDDGFADFHREALPLLRRYGFTATVFVTTGWIADAGRHAAGRRPGRMLSWSQIREAADGREWRSARTATSIRSSTSSRRAGSGTSL